MDFRTRLSSSSSWSSLLLSSNELQNMLRSYPLSAHSFIALLFEYIKHYAKDKRNEQKPQSCYVQRQRTPISLLKICECDTIRYIWNIHHRIPYQWIVSTSYYNNPKYQVHTRNILFILKFVCFVLSPSLSLSSNSYFVFCKRNRNEFIVVVLYEVWAFFELVTGSMDLFKW